MPDALRFARACIATPHHVASAAGAAALDGGGNAVDAAVAANLVLAVVTPYHCGLGGDLLAIVVEDGHVVAHTSVGRAPGGATVDAIRAANGSDRMPPFGPLTVTVPGAVDGWFRLLERHGTRSFGELSRWAVDLARDGFPLSRIAAHYHAVGRGRYPQQDEWQRRFGGLAEGDVLVQPGQAEALRMLAVDGPDAFYDGPIGASIVETLRRGGSPMAPADLKGHAATEVAPLRVGFGSEAVGSGVEVLQLPPPTQGVTAATALAVASTAGFPSDPGLRAHLQVEAVRAALADREEYVTDPEHMAVEPSSLFAPERVGALAVGIDPDRAAVWPPARPRPGGTAYVCAADREGRAISLIQSNYQGFGSGVVEPRFGIPLHNRGAHFSLDPSAADVIAPGKQPMHTLIPSLALREGQPWLVFGAMGGDGQPQTQLQLLTRILVDGEDLGHALDAPRWRVSVADGSVAIESRAPAEVIEGLRRRGHRVHVRGAYNHDMGHANAIRFEPHGYSAASDPRTEGAATGV